MRETLTDSEKEFLKLFRKAMKPRKELLEKAKEAELREFVIKKMVQNCPVKEYCRIYQKMGRPQGKVVSKTETVKTDVGNKV